MKEYYVYIATNENKTVLYTGVTNSLFRRLSEHIVAENPLTFTSKYGVNRLLYFEIYQDVRYAISREKEIKDWRREKKVRLIETVNPYWKFMDDKE